MENYKIEFNLILHAGNAKSMVMEAINYAKKGCFPEAYKKLEEAEKELNVAHCIEKELLVDEANGVDIKTGILMIHAQDHLSMAIMVMDQAQDFITLYERIAEIERRYKE